MAETIKKTWILDNNGNKVAPKTTIDQVINSNGEKLSVELAKKVDLVEGKVLSSNDYTNTEKEKLATISQGAEKNIINAVKVNNVDVPITDKTVNISVPTKASDVDAIPSSTTHLSGDVPVTRTINGKALSSNITLNATDVGALSSSVAIPTKISDLSDDSNHRTVTDEEKALWNSSTGGGYVKPDDGIPKSDLAADIVTSLGKADTALQEHQDISGKADVATTLDGYGITDAYTKSEVDKAIEDAIDAMPEPMVFKGSLGVNGTITELPSASKENEGFTYKVITEGTYAGQNAIVGDTFISDGTTWVLIPSGDDPSGTGTVTSVGVSVPTGLSVSGSPITTSGTIAISMETGYSIPTISKQTDWDNKQSALSTEQIAATNSGITKSIVDAIPSSYAPTDAQANVIETIKVNNTTLTPSSKTVNITVPTQASDIGALPNTTVIPTESTVSGWGFTKNSGTYSKPSGGIPKTDLASAVQTSLGKADTALQSYTEKYTGTYSKPSGGIPASDLTTTIQATLTKADNAPNFFSGTDDPASSLGVNGDIYIKIIS